MFAIYKDNKIEFCNVLPRTFEGYEVRGTYGFISAIASPVRHMKQEQDPSYKMPFYMNFFGLEKEAYKDAIDRGLIEQEAEKNGDDMAAMTPAIKMVLAALSE
jgi:hypothetical protein